MFQMSKRARHTYGSDESVPLTPSGRGRLQMKVGLTGGLSRCQGHINRHTARKLEVVTGRERR